MAWHDGWMVGLAIMVTLHYSSLEQKCLVYSKKGFDLMHFMLVILFCTLTIFNRFDTWKHLIAQLSHHSIYSELNLTKQKKSLIFMLTRLAKFTDAKLLVLPLY